MKITEVKSSDKITNSIVKLGSDVIVHLDEVITTTTNEDGTTTDIYTYQGVMIDNGSQYTEDAIVSIATKALKEQKLSNIVVTTKEGNSFDGDESSRNNMMSAITASGILGVTSTQWKLHDNTVVSVSLAELQEALALSIQEAGNIILGANQ